MPSRADRLRGIGLSALPPPWTEAGKKAREKLSGIKDENFKKFVEQRFEVAKNSLFSTLHNGAGLPADKVLREFLQEYNNRAFAHGLWTMPTSFNFVEAFLAYRPDLNYFSLQPERDFLISFSGFFDWFTSDACSGNLSECLEGMAEGVAYSFNNSDNPKLLEFKLGDDDSFCLVSYSLIRFGSEIHAVLQYGERKALGDPYVELDQMDNIYQPPGKAEIRPAPDLPRQRITIEGISDRQRILAMARFDVLKRTEPYRYRGEDLGDRYGVLTDDFDANRDIQGKLDKSREEIYRAHTLQLDNYQAVFETAKSLLFLPRYCNESAESMRLRRQPTALKKELQSLKSKRKIESAEASTRILVREIRELLFQPGPSPTSFQVLAPQFNNPRAGYWKNLLPWESGTDQSGKETRGRTWIKTNEPFNPDSSPKAHVVESTGQGDVAFTGPNAGFIYVMRNPGQERRIYKVGLTRRTTTERATELSRATGVLDYFVVVEDWAVADCVRAEAEIHRRLSEWRVTGRREFFRCDYKQIFRVIHEVVESINEEEGPAK